MVKTDCQMYNTERKRCTGLKDTYCKYENCKFYKKGKRKDGQRKTKR